MSGYNGDKPFARRKDLLIIAAILLVALAAWLVLRPQGGAGARAEIYCYGELVHTDALGGRRTFSIDEAPQITFEVADGTIAFIRSDCPDQVCVHSGRQSRGGDFAACLPNGVTLWIVDDEPESPDITAR